MVFTATRALSTDDPEGQVHTEEHIPLSSKLFHWCLIDLVWVSPRISSRSNSQVVLSNNCLQFGQTRVSQGQQALSASLGQDHELLGNVQR